MVLILLIYLGIGLTLSMAVFIYALTLVRKGRVFKIEPAAYLFLFHIPMLWPVHLYSVFRDLVQRKFKR